MKKAITRTTRRASSISLAPCFHDSYKFLNDDFALISPLAFITLLILAFRSALKATNTTASRFKLLVVLTVILGLVVVYGLINANPPPQCPDSYPDNYTQQQIDTARSHCIVGADIGAGIYVYFLFIVAPFAITLISLWTSWLLSYYKKKRV